MTPAPSEPQAVPGVEQDAPLSKDCPMRPEGLYVIYFAHPRSQRAHVAYKGRCIFCFADVSAHS